MADIIAAKALRQSSPTPFDVTPDAATRARIAGELALIKLPKLSFAGQIEAQGKRDWQLTGRLGATVVQACVVTLEPVTTRIDLDIRRTFVADWTEPDDAEAEMPEDETVEPLRDTYDLVEIAQEAVALALPDFPRAEGVEPVEITAAPEGTDPLTDETVKPFAGLAALRDKLKRDE